MLTQSPVPEGVGVTAGALETARVYSLEKSAPINDSQATSTAMAKRSHPNTPNERPRFT
jgi:hypothetical protein